jgi:hypothetical protein
MTHPDPDIKYVMWLPHCPFDWDRPAAFEVTTIWGAAAWLCEQHMTVYRRNGDPVFRLLLGPARRLPSREEVMRYIEAQSWHPAQAEFRGQRQSPHEYVTIQRSTAPYTQLRVLAYIRAHATRRRAQFSYWRPGDGHEYWDINPTQTILNRRSLSEEN